MGNRRGRCEMRCDGPILILLTANVSNAADTDSTTLILFPLLDFVPLLLMSCTVWVYGCTDGGRCFQRYSSHLSIKLSPQFHSFRSGLHQRTSSSSSSYRTIVLRTLFRPFTPSLTSHHPCVSSYSLPPRVMVRYVAGDIGGTNSRLQLIELPEDAVDGQFNQELERVVAEETYPSQKYASLTFIIQKFLEAVSHTTHSHTHSTTHAPHTSP